MRPTRTEGPPEKPPPEERHVREAPEAAQSTDHESRFVDLMHMLSMILSARAILAGAILGAFVIGIVVAIWPSWERLAVLAVYGLAAVAPAAWLELRRPR